MTDKKGEVSASVETTEQDKKASFAVEGAEALIEEALATMEMDSSKLTNTESQEVQENNEENEENEENEDIVWEEPEVRDEGSETVENITPVSAQKVSELETALEEANRAKDEAESERKKLYEQLLRTTAEFDNFRKRTQREKEDLRRFGSKKLMLDLLDVIDNFSRALSTLSSAEDSVREGIEMVHRQFLDILVRHGVKKFESNGQPFDYTKHQAISVFETSDTPPQMVHETFKDGYEFHDQLLRPAMVVVTKAPAVPSIEELPQSEETGSFDQDNSVS